ncbi:hypothetical protein QYF36_005760 [Acer negundo]|nr:hypothetical protein QYF36_005760 [Acer negundo]
MSHIPEAIRQNTNLISTTEISCLRNGENSSILQANSHGRASAGAGPQVLPFPEIALHKLVGHDKVKNKL